MAYEKQNFTDGQVLTAEHLNHIEDGIAAAEQTGGGSVSDEQIASAVEAYMANNAVIIVQDGTTLQVGVV